MKGRQVLTTDGGGSPGGPGAPKPHPPESPVKSPKKLKIKAFAGAQRQALTHKKENKLNLPEPQTRSPDVRKKSAQKPLFVLKKT